MASDNTAFTIIALAGVGFGLWYASKTGLLDNLMGGGIPASAPGPVSEEELPLEGEQLPQLPGQGAGGAGEDFTFEELGDIEEEDEGDKKSKKKSKKKGKDKDRDRDRDRDRDERYDDSFGQGYPFGFPGSGSQYGQFQYGQNYGQSYGYNPYIYRPFTNQRVFPLTLAPPPGTISSIYNIPVPVQVYHTRSKSPETVMMKPHQMKRYNKKRYVNGYGPFSSAHRLRAFFVNPINENLPYQRTAIRPNDFYSDFIIGYPMSTYSPYSPYNQYYQYSQSYNPYAQYINPYAGYPYGGYQNPNYDPRSGYPYPYNQQLNYPYGMPRGWVGNWYDDIDPNRYYRDDNTRQLRKCIDCMEDECRGGRDSDSRGCRKCRKKCKKFNFFEDILYSIFPFFRYDDDYWFPDPKYRIPRRRRRYYPYTYERNCPPGSYRASDGFCYGYPIPGPPAPPAPPADQDNNDQDSNSNYARTRAYASRVRNSYGTFRDLDAELQNYPRNRLDVHHYIANRPSYLSRGRIASDTQVSSWKTDNYGYFDREEDLVNIAISS